MGNQYEVWYHRGKAARGSRLPRELNDGRVSLVNRQAFYAGWDAEDEMIEPLDAAEVDKWNNFLAGWLEEIKANDSPSSPVL